MIDAPGLTALLRDSALDGRPVEDAGRDVLAVRCSADEVWPAWQAARSVLDRSGRWPVVICSWDDPADDDWFVAVGSSRHRVVVAAAADVDPWSVFTRDEGSDASARGQLDRRIELASLPPSRIPVARHLTEREELWFEPADQACAVLFLDTDRTWESAARLAFHGALTPDREAALVAAERGWHERYGAELVASWDTMLQFVVSRRPATVDEAWELTGQQLAVGGSLQVDRADLALALLQSDFWFLHDRP